jgi:hypothetical protein
MSQKLIKEVSPPADGRHSLAHGPSADGWVVSLAPSPPLLPRQVGEGAQKRVAAIFPRVFALGYNISSLPGLRKALRHEEDFVSEPPTQDTSNTRLSSSC